MSGTNWMSEWPTAEAFSLRIGEICATVPLRGAWEPNDRISFAMASFRLAQEHHSSIHLLFRHNKNASANALARPLLEAGLRALWLAQDASDEEIKAIAAGRESKLPLLGELSSFASGKGLKGKHRGLLDSLTHGGIRAMAAQSLDDGKQSQLQAVMIGQAGTALSGAGYAIALLLGRQDLQDQLNDAYPAW